jgi:hypothetical protein
VDRKDKPGGGVAQPEDLDVNMVGSELLFILTSTGDPLSLTVQLANNGGHDTDDYFAYLTFAKRGLFKLRPRVVPRPETRPPCRTEAPH